jgi:hypothetical protein
VGYNGTLVQWSVEAGASFRYFSQDNQPWCQTLAPRWLRSRAQGNDTLGKWLEPVTEATTKKSMVVQAQHLGDGRGYGIAGDGERRAVTISQPNFKADLHERVEALRPKLVTFNTVPDLDQIRRYLEYGCGPILKQTAPKLEKRVLEFEDSKNLIPIVPFNGIDIGEQAKDQETELLEMFLHPGSFWLISRSGNPGHMMAAFHDDSMFHFFEPWGGEFGMNNEVLKRWLTLAPVKKTLMGDSFATFERFRKVTNGYKTQSGSKLLDECAIDSLDDELENI